MQDTQKKCSEVPDDLDSGFVLGCDSSDGEVKHEGKGIRQLIWWTTLVVIGVAGCSDEKAAAPAVCEVCNPGSIECVGDYVVTCSGDGTLIDEPFLRGRKTCDGSTGACTSSQCPSKGFRGCTDEVTVSFCSSGQLEQNACDAGEVCRAGSCVSESFEGTICGYEAVIVGTGGDLAVTQCGPGECTEGEEVPECAARVCESGTRACQTRQVGVVEVSIAQVCNADGTGADGTQEVELHRAWWSLYRWFLRLWC